MLARNLIWSGGFLGAVLFLGIFFREVGEFEGLLVERGLRTFQIVTWRAGEVVVDQFLFMLLER